jgi:hemerythrin
MKIPEDEFQTYGVGLNTLDEEHAEIHLRFVALEDAIFQAEGSPRILETAKNLAQSMLLHFCHEAQFLERIAFPVPAGQRGAGTKMRGEILRIEEELGRDEIYASLHLRSLCKEWMSKHLYMEHIEFEIAGLVNREELGRIQA